MAEYDFDKVYNRRNTNSLKWDVKENETPMWVADMDFQTAPEIMEAVLQKAQSGIYGYQIVPDAWYEAIGNWWKNRHHFELKKEWLIFCTGVIPAVTCAVKRLTNIGDNVIVQTPVYDIFFHSVENHGRHVLENKLQYDGTTYHIDFKDLEEKLSNPLTTLMILCNPQNPTGRIWTKDELAKIGELCAKYHVVVIADEIHCDLTRPGLEYTPFASVSDACKGNSITCISATKTFNLAGLQTSAVSIPNRELYAKMERGLNSEEVAEPNCFAIESVVAAFTKGEKWLDELRQYIEDNRKTVENYVNLNLPQMKIVALGATYLLWLDCTEILAQTKSRMGDEMDTAKLCHFIRKKTGLFLTAGGVYRGDGKSFIRMNIACPRETLNKGLELLKTGIQAYLEEQKA